MVGEVLKAGEAQVTRVLRYSLGRFVRQRVQPVEREPVKAVLGKLLRDFLGENCEAIQRQSTLPQR